MQWNFIESIQEGIGALTGNQLIVQWQSIDNNNDPYKGTVKLTVTENDELYGTKTAEGRPGKESETAFPNQ